MAVTAATVVREARLSNEGRAAAYAAAFPQYPASHLHVTNRWVQGVWMLGNNYRGSGYYGAFPPGLLRRIYALFPDLQGRVLHLCSGSLRSEDVAFGDLHVVRVDLQRTWVRPSVQADAQHLPFPANTFELTILDPPYGKTQAKQYGTPMPNRLRLLAEARRVTVRGGHLVYLDTQVPMYRKDQWRFWGVVGVIRSTNHVIRALRNCQEISTRCRRLVAAG